MKETTDLDVVLDELYALDPGLRDQEASLRALAKELLAARPEAPIDEAFVARLRSELQARSSNRPSTNPILNFFTMPTKNPYLIPGLAVLVLAVVGIASLTSLDRSQAPAPSDDQLAVADVERVSPGAFGPLVGGSPSAMRSESGGGGMGLGAGAPQGTSAVPALPPMAGGDATVDSKMMIAPDYVPTIYKHVYKGGAIEGLAAEVDVYRRARGGAGAGPVDALVDYDLGLMNLGAARDASVQTFSLAENRENGYVITVNPEEGTINIYENYLTWTYPERNCTDEACFNSFRLTEADMLPDAEAISIAEAFLAQYGVSKDGYGAPIVRDDWRSMLLRSTDKASFWFPDVATVVYPQMIDGKMVRDESGAPHGLNVNVNVRHKRATGIWNLATRNFQVSTYAGETDTAALIAIAEKGGIYGDTWMPEGATVVEVELGTPTVEWSRVWQWNQNVGNELTVPTLVFPVLNAPKDYWRSTVTVPLAKDLLQVPGGSVGVPTPMPVDLPATTEPAAR
jgi:hypothetical protein